ncbi:MAG: hypothetical protein M3O67_03255 [Bacteroidota bacterium]|nr:hypothetical protein [Bacteroidota bacterium]
MLYSRHKKVTLFTYFIFYYAIFLSFALSQRLLSQYQPIFFTHNRDLAELFILSIGLPVLMIKHPPLYFVTDFFMLITPVILIIFYLRYKIFSISIGIFFLFLFSLYFLLQNIFTQLHPEMFMGLFVLAFVFTTNKEKYFYNILALCRYFFIYLFVSAAIWKIARGSFLNIDQFSNILISQHDDILSTNCNTIICRFYFFLIDNIYFSYALYIGAIVMELFFAIGFFTRRFDKILLLLAIIFFIFDHLIMRIPFWPAMVCGISFLIKEKSKNVNDN